MTTQQPASTEWEKDKITVYIHNEIASVLEVVFGPDPTQDNIINRTELARNRIRTLFSHHQQETERQILAARKEEVAHWSKMKSQWQREATSKIVDAWVNSGTRPDVHYAEQEHLRKNWPTLYMAIQAIISENTNQETK